MGGERQRALRRPTEARLRLAPTPGPSLAGRGGLNRHYALTGGPGVGKTTLLAEFVRHGFAVAHESGRAVIREHPEFATADRTREQSRRFTALVLERDRRTLSWAGRQAGPVIFDRTAVDNSVDGSGDEQAVAASIWLSGPVALLPIWPAIFERDAQRRWSLAQAKETEVAVCRAYARLGHAIVEVPRSPIAERFEWLRQLWGV